MDLKLLRQDVANGLLSATQVLDLCVAEQQLLQQQVAQLQQELAQLRQRLEQPTSKLDQPFSMRAEEKRAEARTGKKRSRKNNRKHRQRLKAAEKLQQAQRVENVYPPDVEPNDCKLAHTRVVWRLEQGQAVLVGYYVFRGPNKQLGVIPGVLGRSEFSLEIVLTLAHLVIDMGLSLDKVCAILAFLQKLRLSKSQAEALLKQLARHWEQEFEVLCQLLANSLVVHADETSWSIHSVWTLLSEKARLVLYGVHKDGATLEVLLDPQTFGGLVISDHAAVYGKFSVAQKCWAHLIRKAIKLTLQDPDNEVYRTFTDNLLDVYQKARQLRADQRYSVAGKQAKAEEWTDELYEFCDCCWEEEPVTGLEHDRRLLAREVIELANKNELFQFVWAEPAVQPNGQTKAVDGTNNEAERSQRPTAQARATGRTSKTGAGARRTSILRSVLESLRLYLKAYTLESIVAEISRWQEAGKSCFRQLLEELNLTLPEKSILDRVMPSKVVPDG